MKNKKTILWTALVLIAIGFAFVVWGGIIYRHFPGIKEARHIQWQATVEAGFQYFIGFICLITGYIFLQKSEK